MKKLFAAVLFLASCRGAHASPYFRPLDLKHINPVIGSVIDPFRGNQRDAIGIVPVITHSPKDGCWLPSVVCEDWSPLAVGIAGNLKSDPYMAIGPLFNAAPAGKGLLLAGLNAITAEGTLSNIKDELKPSLGPSGFDASLSLGPMWVVKPQENFKGYFKVIVGAALKF